MEGRVIELAYCDNAVVCVDLYQSCMRVILFFVVRRKELLCLFYLRVVLTVLVFDGAQLTGSAM